MNARQQLFSFHLDVVGRVDVDLAVPSSANSPSRPLAGPLSVPLIGPLSGPLSSPLNGSSSEPTQSVNDLVQLYYQAADCKRMVDRFMAKGRLGVQRVRGPTG